MPWCAWPAGRPHHRFHARSSAELTVEEVNEAFRAQVKRRRAPAQRAVQLIEPIVSSDIIGRSAAARPDLLTSTMNPNGSWSSVVRQRVGLLVSTPPTLPARGIGGLTLHLWIGDFFILEDLLPVDSQQHVLVRTDFNVLMPMAAEYRRPATVATGDLTWPRIRARPRPPRGQSSGQPRAAQPADDSPAPGSSADVRAADARLRATLAGSTCCFEPPASNFARGRRAISLAQGAGRAGPFVNEENSAAHRAHASVVGLFIRCRGRRA